MNERPLVSVVIPTKNSGRTIKTCLKSVKEQTYSKIEIVAVDDHSVDETRQVIMKYGGRVIKAIALRSRARNIGATNSRGKLILFLDSDMELLPRVVEKCVYKVKEGYDTVVIPEVSVGSGFWARCKSLEKSCYIGDELIEASRFFKREIFEAVKGYDPELEAGEDWDLNQRIRNSSYRVGRINVFIKHHEGRLSLWKTAKKKYQYGKTLEKYKRKHPSEAKQQFRFIRPSFVKNWRKLAGNPIHTFGMIIMKTCEFVAAWIGRLSE